MRKINTEIHKKRFQNRLRENLFWKNERFGKGSIKSRSSKYKISKYIRHAFLLIEEIESIQGVQCKILKQHNVVSNYFYLLLHTCAFE